MLSSRTMSRAKKEARAFNTQGGKLKRGVGIACHSFGIGYCAEVSQLAIELNPDDGVTIYAAIADPGEGNDSMVSQIVAHQLGLPLEKVRLHLRDTEKTVGMGPAAGSRMTFAAGNVLLNAIENMQKAMKEAGAKNYAGLKAAGRPTRFDGFVKNPGAAGIDKITGQGTPFLTRLSQYPDSGSGSGYRNRRRSGIEDDGRDRCWNSYQPASHRRTTGRRYGPGGRFCFERGVHRRQDQRLCHF